MLSTGRYQQQQQQQQQQKVAAFLDGEKKKKKKFIKFTMDCLTFLNIHHNIFLSFHCHHHHVVHYNEHDDYFLMTCMQ